MMWVALLLLFPLSVQAEDPGELNANPFHSASTSNPFGGGNPLSSNSGGEAGSA